MITPTSIPRPRTVKPLPCVGLCHLPYRHRCAQRRVRLGRPVDSYEEQFASLLWWSPHASESRCGEKDSVPGRSLIDALGMCLCRRLASSGGPESGGVKKALDGQRKDGRPPALTEAAHFFCPGRETIRHSTLLGDEAGKMVQAMTRARPCSKAGCYRQQEEAKVGRVNRTPESLRDPRAVSCATRQEPAGRGWLGRDSPDCRRSRRQDLSREGGVAPLCSRPTPRRAR